MAKGLDKSRERKEKVSLFGKTLTKRAKSTCELCEARNVRLEIVEIPPILEEPNLEKCIFICEECRKNILNFKKTKENDLRFLNLTVWSEVPMVKAVSIYILRGIKEKYSWAEDILDGVYIEEEIEELVKEIAL